MLLSRCGLDTRPGRFRCGSDKIQICWRKSWFFALTPLQAPLRVYPPRFQQKTPLSCQDENSAKQTLGIGCILGRMFTARGPLLSLNTKFIIPVREDLVKQNPPGSGIIFEKRAEPFTTVPRFLGPRRSPASAGSVGRGGARQRVTFSPRGGNRTSGLCADDVTLHLFETRF